MSGFVVDKKVNGEWVFVTSIKRYQNAEKCFDRIRQAARITFDGTTLMEKPSSILESKEEDCDMVWYDILQIFES